MTGKRRIADPVGADPYERATAEQLQYGAESLATDMP
jgi:hypothetical protein